MNGLSAQDWNARYQEGDTPWDLQSPTPEFVQLAKELPEPGRALVPGAGRGYDGIFLAERGWQVDVLDFAPAAVAAVDALAQKSGVKVATHCQDFFSPPADFAGAFDLVWEYTFFCAIDPSLRAEYVRVVQGLLKPGGRLLALFFPLSTDKPGPPFPVARAEIETLFAPYFSLEFREPKASVTPRAGRELVGIFTRK